LKANKTIEGNLIASNLKFCIVKSRFNHLVTDRLLEGAIDAIVRHGGEEKNIEVVLVPGSMELPFAAKKAAFSGKYDAVIALGAVIRGETPHFDFVASESAKGLAQVALESEIPVIYGVLTTDDVNQALERAGVKSGNKGFQAAVSAIEMANLVKQLRKSRK